MKIVTKKDILKKMVDEYHRYYWKNAEDILKEYGFEYNYENVELLVKTYQNIYVIHDKKIIKKSF